MESFRTDGYMSWAKSPFDPKSHSPFRQPRISHRYPVAAHALDTAIVAWHLWDVYLSAHLKRQIRDLIASDVSTLTDRDDMARRRFAVLAGAHDIGKVNPYFQTAAAAPWTLEKGFAESVAVDLDANGRSRGLPNLEIARLAHRHENVGQYLLARRSRGCETPPRPIEPISQLSIGELTAGGHHGRWRLAAERDLDALYLSATSDPTWTGEQEALLSHIERLTGARLSDIQVADPSRSGDLAVVLTGAVMTADRLASSVRIVEEGARLIDLGISPLDGSYWWDARVEALRGEVAHALGVATPISVDEAQRRLLGEHSPHPVQAAVAEVATNSDGKMLVIQASTGEGKSESAFLRHWHLPNPERMIFALPTTATTNAMSRRMRRWLVDTGQLVVVSHSRDYGDDPVAARHQHPPGAGEDCCIAPLHGTDWLDRSDTKMFAPYVATTCDQVLGAALRRPHVAMRLFALLNAHLVLDEVHTYDQYQTGLLLPVMAFLGRWRTNVTILSATMPNWQLSAVLDAYRGAQTSEADAATEGPRDYPALHVQSFDEPRASAKEFATNRGHRVYFETRFYPDGPQAHIDWARQVRRARPHARIGIVVNTVDRAIQIADSLRNDPSVGEVLLLHAAMTQRQRETIEADIELRVGSKTQFVDPVVIVGTQVIEASLDLDVDFMSTDICPATSIVQRLGRLWRSTDQTSRQQRLRSSSGDNLNALRSLNVVCEDPDGDEKVGFVTAMPYLVAEILRVHQSLRKRAHHGLLVPEDVPGFVDEGAFSLAEFETNEAESPGASSVAREEAIRARKFAARAQHVAFGRTVPKRMKDLAEMSGEMSEPLDAELHTRFIDAPSGSFLVLGDHDYLTRLEVAALLDLRPGAGVAELGAAISTQYGRKNAFDAAHVRTMQSSGLDPADWAPKAYELRRYKPVRVADLEAEGIRFDPVLGFVRIQDE